MGRYEPKKLHQDFELDLAPLLAVMVKLVPVLIVSSAFVQVSIIETDLPQVVKEEIAKPADDKNPVPQLILNINQDGSGIVAILNSGKVETTQIPATKDGKFDLNFLYQNLVQIKTKFPQIYKLELKPQPQVPYDLLVKIMDEARKAKEDNLVFPVIRDGQEVMKTPYMFPDVVFANVIEG